MDNVNGMLLLWLAGLAGLLLIPSIAHRKGYSFWGFAVLTLVAWPIALVVALVISPKHTTIVVGQAVRVRDAVPLTDGGRIPRGHVSQVAALDVIEGHAVVQLSAPDGSLRWIAKSNVLPV